VPAPEEVGDRGGLRLQIPGFFNLNCTFYRVSLRTQAIRGVRQLRQDGVLLAAAAAAMEPQRLLRLILMLWMVPWVQLRQVCAQPERPGRALGRVDFFRVTRPVLNPCATDGPRSGIRHGSTSLSRHLLLL
jgi:hypothetical protein